MVSAILGLLLMSVIPNADARPDFEGLWNFGDPAATEAKFRELLPELAESGNADLHAQLLTQVARTLGLQRRFDEAHRLLDDVQVLLEPGPSVARVRFLLERGRTLNSGGSPKLSVPLFELAWDEAREIGAWTLAVDAAHMMGIVTEGEASVAWNRKAMELAESSSERARGWLGSLYNNLGWTYHDRGDYEEALTLFEKALAWHADKGKGRRWRIARWAVARCHRSLGRVEEALAEQQRLLDEAVADGGEPSGYVYEELGECLLLLGREDEARPRFRRAHEILSKDEWLKANEADRLARLERLGRT